jgi:hypothetical protein
MRQLLFSVLVAVAVPALAQHQPPPGADANQFKPLPERNDVVSWKVLSQVELVKQKDRYVPQFAKDVAALDQKEVKVQGFMMPLQVGDKQSHFVLTAMPGKHGRGQNQDAGEVHVRAGRGHRQDGHPQGRSDRRVLSPDRRDPEQVESVS